MTKITLANLANLQNDTTAVNAINANSGIIVAALDNTLSRDGTTPNTMGSNLDLNSNQILNLPAPATANSPARLVDVTSPAAIASVPPVGTSGAVVGLLNANNTYSGNNIYSGTNSFPGVNTFGTGTVLGGHTTIEGVTTTGTTGTGNNVLSISPTLTSPVLVTPNIGAATGTSESLTGGPTYYNATAVPAGGTSGTGIKLSSVANLGVFFGSGLPTLTAAQGSLYIRTDGSSTSTRMYINTTGTNAWTNVTTAT